MYDMVKLNRQTLTFSMQFTCHDGSKKETKKMFQRRGRWRSIKVFLCICI